MISENTSIQISESPFVIFDENGNDVESGYLIAEGYVEKINDTDCIVHLINLEKKVI